jgi:hypothetical protein
MKSLIKFGNWEVTWHESFDLKFLHISGFFKFWNFAYTKQNQWWFVRIWKLKVEHFIPFENRKY